MRVVRSRTVAAVVALGVVLTLSGCGFAQALAHPEAQQTADPVPTMAPAAAPSTTPGPRVVAHGALLAGGAQVGTVQVSVGPVVTGLVPPVREFGLDCPVSGPALQYVPVEISFTLADDGDDGGGLAGHLTAAPGPATPADIGDLGVFFRPSQDDDEPSCADYPPLPTTDRFWARGTPLTTGYVVLDQAVGPTTPEGRAEVFPTLQLRVDHLRIRDYSARETPLTLGPLTVGAACPDDAGAICTPAG
jgi:hypothetical protein